jgi:hypothetical protein
LVQAFTFNRRNTHGHRETPTNIKVLFQKFERLQCRYYWWEEFMMYAVEMASCGMIYLPSFMKTATGIQAVLRFCLRNLKGSNAGIIDGRDLRSAPLRWAQVA